MTDETLPTARDAYELLSKPTLQLTEDDVLAICTDLRRRRQAYLNGVQDKPKKVKAPAKAITAEEKLALTQQVAASLDLGDISL